MTLEIKLEETLQANKKTHSNGVKVRSLNQLEQTLGKSEKEKKCEMNLTKTDVKNTKGDFIASTINGVHLGAAAITRNFDTDTTLLMQNILACNSHDFMASTITKKLLK